MDKNVQLGHIKLEMPIRHSSRDKEQAVGHAPLECGREFRTRDISSGTMST